jgi:hypothetical protein
MVIATLMNILVFSKLAKSKFHNSQCILRRNKFDLRMQSDPNVILNKFSRTITEPPSQGASQAMLYATGLTPQTISSPQVSYQFKYSISNT